MFGVDILFNYVGDISSLAHDIILKYLKTFDTAIDGTLGNGHDTDFLSKNFKKVYSFEVQKTAVEKYETICPDNVTLINDSHQYLKEYIPEKLDCAIYNLGFLPGGDKSITTNSDSTLKSLISALQMLKDGGIICIAIYTGHEEGKKERDALLSFAEELPKNEFGVMLHSFMNRVNSPMLLIIERNSTFNVHRDNNN